MKNTFLLIFTLFYTLHSFAQYDDHTKGSGSLNIQAKATKTRIKATKEYTIENTKKNKIVSLNNTAAKYLKNKNNSKSAVMIPKPERGVYTKKIFQGKDLTFAKRKTTSELGTISTKSKKIVIECRDHSLVDGDIISVFVNDVLYRSNIILKNNFFVIDVDLNMGYNKIDFLAKNQGYSGPNTAEFVVYDIHGNLIFKQGWNINTGESATFGVIRTQ